MLVCAVLRKSERFQYCFRSRSFGRTDCQACPVHMPCVYNLRHVIRTGRVSQLLHVQHWSQRPKSPTIYTQREPSIVSDGYAWLLTAIMAYSMNTCREKKTVGVETFLCERHSLIHSFGFHIGRVSFHSRVQHSNSKCTCHTTR